MIGILFTILCFQTGHPILGIFAIIGCILDALATAGSRSKNG